MAGGIALLPGIAILVLTALNRVLGLRPSVIRGCNRIVTLTREKDYILAGTAGEAPGGRPQAFMKDAPK
jgi:hypothetical protein